MPPGAASLLPVTRAEGHLKLSDSMADLAAKKADWWRQNEDNLPHWAGVLKTVLLVQPSSAAAVRAFSLL